MNILSIGNSFSCDAQRYLHRIARADGVKMTTVNLYIGGCPLSKHFRNMHSEERAYTLEVNGESTGFKVSIKEALLNREWDVITLQQASPASPRYETYQPYLSELSSYVKALCPKAKIYIHQTWAYEEGSAKLVTLMGYAKASQMYSDIVNAYQSAAQAINADGILPGGEVFASLLEKGIPTVHRDTYHASYGLGRFALGLTWYRFLTGNDVTNNSFCDFDAPISEEEIAIVKQCVTDIASRYGK